MAQAIYIYQGKQSKKKRPMHSYYANTSTETKHIKVEEKGEEETKENKTKKTPASQHSTIDLSFHMQWPFQRTGMDPIHPSSSLVLGSVHTYIHYRYMYIQEEEAEAERRIVTTE